MTDCLEVYKTFREESLILPGKKIRVFISSICGVERYDKVRLKLKNAIEATQLAEFIFLKVQAHLLCLRETIILGH